MYFIFGTYDPYLWPPNSDFNYNHNISAELPKFYTVGMPYMSESYQFHHEEYYVPIEGLSKHIIFDTVNKGYGDIRK